MGVRMSLLMTALLVVAGLLVNGGVLVSTNAVMAADGSIPGVVADDAGKPIRGAIVKATLGRNSVARFTDASGRYQISGLQGESYDVSATAWGFGSKTLKVGAGQASDANFSLNHKWDLNRISEAEL